MPDDNKTTITLDAADLNETYKSSFEGHHQEAKSNADAEISRMGLMQSQSLFGDTGDAIVAKVNDLCDDWSDIRATIDRGLQFASWVPRFAPYVAKVKSFVTMVDQKIIPAVCGTTEAMRSVGGRAGTAQTGIEGSSDGPFPARRSDTDPDKPLPGQGTPGMSGQRGQTR